MNRRRALLLGSLGLLALAGAASYEAVLVAQQRRALDAAARDLAAAHAALLAQRESTAALNRDLAAAEKQLGELPAPRADELGAAQRAELQAWLARVQELKQRFEKDPAQRVPEMALLTEADWLRCARRARFENSDDTRAALAEVRAAAKQSFARLLATALRKFTGQAGGQPPVTVQALIPFLDQPLDPAIFARYEISTGKLPNKGDTWGIIERAALDPEFDSRTTLSVGRGTAVYTSSGLEAWTPGLQEQLTAAFHAYRKANGGQPPKDTAATLPYMNPPLDPALAARLVQLERRSAW
jgi:hypothetical protein